MLELSRLQIKKGKTIIWSMQGENGKVLGKTLNYLDKNVEDRI